ncbi:acyltransferase domain-containing protein [Streptomyces sp. NPDC018045]|uniref:acyltransferase domain-containing protein n=1 Tax=Streptomyces sp. NPDC018045 TaxID=3365037 RepID=UPI00378B9F29
MSLTQQAPAGEGGAPRPVALLFPGQGSQHVRMAAGLYRHDPVFTEAMDAAVDLLGDAGHGVRADWLSEAPDASIDTPGRAQPLLFAVEYALGRMVLGWGVRPAAVLGHSAGELVGAVLAEVIGLADAVRMVHERVAYLSDAPAGGMVAVVGGAEELSPYLVGDVAIAAVNSKRQTMLAGTTGHLAAVCDKLRADGYSVVPVPATVPFHSPALDPAAEAAEAAFRTVRLSPPAFPVYSGYTGELMTDEIATSPRYWARQLTDTVRFGPALDRLLATGDLILVEAGPGQNLTTLARRHRAVRRGGSTAVPLLPARPGSAADERRSVLDVAELLRNEGYPQAS